MAANKQPDGRARHQIEKGQRQVERILAALKEGPLTAAQLTERLHLCPSGINRYLLRLQAEPRRVRIVDYVRNGVRPLNIYALGSEPDEPFVRSRRLDRAKPKRIGDFTVQLDTICAALKGHPQTVAELTQSLKVSVSYLRKYLRLLHESKPKRIYILRWEHPEGRGNLSHVWALGCRKDAKRPEYDRKAYEQSVMADPIKHEAKLARRRRQKKLRKLRNSPHGASPFAALGL